MATVTGGTKLEDVLASLGKRLGKATTVRVGFLEGADYPDGTPVATVAAINNFGAPNAGIPARPFFTTMVAQAKGGWASTFGKALEASDLNTDTALGLLGEVMTGQLQEAIVTSAGPANSPVTDLLKQRFPMRDGMTAGDVVAARRDVADGVRAPAGKPLVWTGFMLRSVGSEVQ